MAPLAGKQIIQPIFELLVGAGLKEIHVNVHYLVYTHVELRECDQRQRREST
jgi:hypothetical protein